jgi:hypothetical protein
MRSTCSPTRSVGPCASTWERHAGIEPVRGWIAKRVGEMNLTIDKLFELAAHLNIEPHQLLKEVTIYDCMGVHSEDDGS